MLKRLVLIVAFVLLPHVANAETPAKEPIKIGDMYAYTALPSLGALYKKGWKQAVTEINAQGGLLGRPVEVVSRDHGDTPEKAILVAQDLIERERVDVLAGTIFAHITNAVANITGAQKMPLVTIWNTMPASEGAQNPYMYSIISTEAQAMAAADYAAGLQIKKWATIAPNFAYGRLAVNLFKDRLKQLRPDIVFVDERWPTLGKIDAASEILSLERVKPDAVFSCIFTSDLTAFVRQGNRRGFFKGKTILGLETGEKAFADDIGKELQGSWVATGDPGKQTTDQAGMAFLDYYHRKFGDSPQFYTYAGYLVYRFIFAAIQKAGSTDPSKVAQALDEVSLSTPMGELRMNSQNHRSNFGVWIGRLQPTDKGVEMIDWSYKDATSYIKTVRPQQ